MKNRPHARPYRSLAWMALLGCAAMFLLMYAMVDVPANVYANLGQFYMAGLMTAPMILIELALMRAMYADRNRNIAIIAGCGIAIIAFWFGIRSQYAVAED